MGAIPSLHHNSIATEKGIWRVCVESAAVISKGVIVLTLELQSDSGRGTRLVRVRMLRPDDQASEQLTDVLDRVRDWIELTDESDDELDLAQFT